MCLRRILNAPPSAAWQYWVQPGRRLEWSFDSLETAIVFTPNEQDRLGPGASNHCAHGDLGDAFREYLDWRPYEYFTCRFTPIAPNPLFKVSWIETFAFEDLGDGRTEQILTCLVHRSFRGVHGLRAAETGRGSPICESRSSDTEADGGRRRSSGPLGSPGAFTLRSTGRKPGAAHSPASCDDCSRPGLRVGSLVWFARLPAAHFRVWLCIGLRPGLQNEVVAEERSALLKEALPCFVRSTANERKIVCPQSK